MKSTNDCVLVRVSLSLTETDPNDSFPTEYACAMGCGTSDASETIDFLRDLADAIDEERVFGFMMEQAFACPLLAGETRPIPENVGFFPSVVKPQPEHD